MDLTRGLGKHTGQASNASPHFFPIHGSIPQQYSRSFVCFQAIVRNRHNIYANTGRSVGNLTIIAIVRKPADQVHPGRVRLNIEQTGQFLPGAFQQQLLPFAI